MTFGLTPTGFNPKTLNDCKTEMEDALKAAFGQSINLEPQSVFGQFVAIMSEREALLWAALEDLDHADDPDGATGASLDKVCAITGTIRNPARYSTTVLTVAGTTGTNLPTGRSASVASTGYKFTTTQPAVIVAVSAWTFLTPYTVGQRVKNGGNVYQCVTAGVSAGSGGPSGTGTNISDGSARWCYIGTGDGAADVLAQAVDIGPVVAVALDITVIETPVSGWGGVRNFLDAVVGAYVETDASLRVRREQELTGSANASTTAIRNKVLKVGVGTLSPVVACHVFENVTMDTDVNGLPPKSIEVLVQGGDDNAVAQAIFDSKAGGIETYGTDSDTIYDDAGDGHVINFTRPTLKPVYVGLWVTKDPDEFPTDGEAQIKAAVVALGNTYRIGKDVTAWAMSSALKGIPGVLEVTQCHIGLVLPLVNSNTITCGIRDLATFDTSRVTVTLANGSP